MPAMTDSDPSAVDAVAYRNPASVNSRGALLLPDCVSEFCDEGLFVTKPSDRMDGLTAAEDDDRRKGLDSKAEQQRGVPLGIHGCKGRVGGHYGSGALQNWLQRPARGAPLGGKIDDESAVGDPLIEVGLSQVDHLRSICFVRLEYQSRPAAPGGSFGIGKHAAHLSAASEVLRPRVPIWRAVG
jgi:hypothetical protein